MTRIGFVLWFIILIVALVSAEMKHNRNNESELIQHLLDGYDKRARPVKNISHPVQVKVGVLVRALNDLIGKSEVLDVSLFLAVTWRDEMLSWDPAEFGGLSDLVLMPSDVWLPDIVFSNSAVSLYQEDHMYFYRVYITNRGSVNWHPASIIQTHCTMDFTYFPFDSQICGLQLESWEYGIHHVHLEASTIRQDNTFKEHSEWIWVRQTSCDNDNDTALSNVKFFVEFKRKSLYNVVNLIIPIIILSVVDLLVFWAPSDDRISLGVTVLLSFSVFLLLLEERMPKSSDTISLLSIYITAVLISTGASLIFSVFVLYLRNKPHTHPPAPGLRAVLCLCPTRHDKAEYDVQTQDKVEKQWTELCDRIDMILFCFFTLLFVALLVVIFYPYDTYVDHVNMDGCPWNKS